MRKSLKENRICNILFIAVTAVYFLLLFYLFYCELTVYPTDPEFRFESDTYVHVKFAVEDGYFYSLSSYIYYILALLPFGRGLIAGFLALSGAASVILTRKLLMLFDVSFPEWLLNLASFSLNLVMGFYIPFVNRQHYIGYQNANMWHNSTYILMKTFALATMLVFIPLYREYSKGIRLKGYIGYTLLLAISTAFKPSFFTVFAPCLAIVLLVDLFGHKAKFMNVFLMALSVVPSFAVLAVQSLVLFDDSGSKMVIAPFRSLFERGDHPKIALFVSPLFIILVILLCFNRIKSDRTYRLGLLFLLMGFMETALIAEEGARGSDGNFLWGYSIALFFAFAVSFYRLYRSYREGTIGKGFLIAALSVYSWHVLSGIWHFVLLLQGFTYFK